MRLDEPLALDMRILEIWTGKWQWVRETAHFTDPLQASGWLEQTLDVEVKDGRLKQLNRQNRPDGTKTGWEHDGAFDGWPRLNCSLNDGHAMVVIAYHQMSETMFADSLYALDGSFRGTEHGLFVGDKLSMYGCITVAGKQYPYFEEWLRVAG